MSKNRNRPTYVEHGANWVHGQVANVAFKIANENGLVEAFAEPWEEQYILEGANDFVDEEITNVFEDIIETLEEKDSENFEAPKGYSLGHYVDERFEVHTSDDSSDLDPKLRPYAAIFKDNYRRNVRVIDGNDNWYDLSYHGSYEMYVELEGNPVTPFKDDKKYEDLVQIFKNDIPYSNILYETFVTKIDYSDPKSVKVLTAKKEEYKADIVVFTGSLGVLKSQAKTLFHPALDNDKLEAIDKIGFGTVDKIYLEFEKDWPRDIQWMSFLFKEPMNFTKEDAIKDWTRFIGGVHILPNAPNILSLWITGEAAKIIENMDIEKVKQDAMNLLRKFLGNVEAFKDIPDPINVQVTKWYSNPSIQGSYSYQTTQSDLANLGPSTLARPQGEGRLLFAGEATHEKYFSTVHGAIESGWREADRIICGLTEK